MSASDLKPGNANPISSPVLQVESPLESQAINSTNHRKDEIEPEAVEILRKFFVLLDQWDQEQRG